MVRILAIVIALLTAPLPQTASACSFAPGYRTFELSGTQLPGSGSPPTTPSLSVVSIVRGTDDGDYASCSDAGILFVSIDDPEAAQDLGFLFELEHGSFPDAVLPEEIVAPVELADGSFGFFFVWLDLPAGSSDVEPIDVRVSVRAVSSTMLEGQKVFLDIQDP